MEEVAACLRARPTQTLRVLPCDRSAFLYWQVVTSGAVACELVAVPKDGFTTASPSIPTAAEPILVKAAKLLPRREFADFVGAGGLLAVYTGSLQFDPIWSAIGSCRDVHGGDTAFSGKYATIEVDEDRYIEAGSFRSLSTFPQCYIASPLKYQFLEVYRSLETHFLYAILKKINTTFFAGPKKAVSQALEALDSEIAQFADMAASAQAEFDSIFDKINALSSANDLAQAIMRKVSRAAGGLNAKSKKGAACIYYIRCAIVHAGDKDIVFENFTGGNDLVSAVLPDAELAALRMSGITLS